MNPKRKISPREAWLVSLLPATLAFIVSLSLPGPADDIAGVERQLKALTGGDAHQRMQKQLSELSTQLETSQRELTELETREAAVRARLQALQTPRSNQALNMAEGLDELSRRLAHHGVQVLAMVEQGGGSHIRPAATSEEHSVSSAGRPRDWRVSVAATWPAVRQALEDASTFPRGLALAAMKMEPPRPDVPLQRWELIVTPAGATP